jgi:hypothetical protein
MALRNKNGFEEQKWLWGTKMALRNKNGFEEQKWLWGTKMALGQGWTWIDYTSRISKGTNPPIKYAA